jgi:hypothetical protein
MIVARAEVTIGNLF